MSEHVWATENLSDYVAGTMTAEESQRLERHLAKCADCRHALAQWQQFDDGLSRLFADVRPSPAVQNRVIQSLRQVRRTRPWLSVATGLAAAVLIGAVGAGVYFSGAADLPLPGNGLAAKVFRTQTKPPTLAVNDPTSIQSASVHGHVHHGGNFQIAAPKSRRPEPQRDEALDGRADPSEAMEARRLAAILDQHKATVARWQLQHDRLEKEVAAGVIEPQVLEEVKLQLRSAQAQENAAVAAMEIYHARRNGAATDNYTVTSSNTTATVDSGASLVNAKPQPVPRDFLAWNDLGAVDANLSRKKGQISDAEQLFETRKPSAPELTLVVDRAKAASYGLTQDDIMKSVLAATNSSISYEKMNFRIDNSNGMQYFVGVQYPEDKFQTRQDVLNIPITSKTQRVPIPLGEVATLKDTEIPSRQTPPEKSVVKVNVANRPGNSLGESLSSYPLDKEKGKDKQPAAGDARLIIRTGEMEFEVASFDAAVKDITTLLKGLGRGTLQTTKSDTLANGKKRGFVIVRVPPEIFDAFVSDLSKIGDLKKQSIGSADVTKQYSDNESDLRALRITQKRCEEILKAGGKGDVKDLIAAEMAMGSLRTQIEKLEGENQYYKNQAALCTLTIHLTEKQIENPAVLTISEKVSLGLAAADVKKALAAGRAAVLELQGRVLQASESKTRGYFSGLLEVEVGHENAAKLRSRLEELGEVIAQQQSVQQSDGGSVQGPKKQFGDVHFTVSLFDQASIRPRETLSRKIAVRDVLAAMARLREKVASLGGQVSADPVEASRTSGGFEFDLAREHQGEIDKVLAELGDLLEKGPPIIVPPAELASRARIGYKLALLNFASQPVRESVELVVEVSDVDGNLSLLRGLFKDAGGTITLDKGPFDDKGELQGLMNSAVPLSARGELVHKIMAMGRVKHQELARNVEPAESTLPLAVFRIRLTGTPSIVPRDDGLWPQVRTGLHFAFWLLAISLMCIVIGVCVLLPWALLIMLIMFSIRLLRRRHGRAAA